MLFFERASELNRISDRGAIGLVASIIDIDAMRGRGGGAEFSNLSS